MSNNKRYPIRSLAVSSVSSFNPLLAILANLSSILALMASAAPSLLNIPRGLNAVFPYAAFFSFNKSVIDSVTLSKCHAKSAFSGTFQVDFFFIASKSNPVVVSSRVFKLSVHLSIFKGTPNFVGTVHAPNPTSSTQSSGYQKVYVV